MWKWTKRCALGAILAGVVGFVAFGFDLFSYGASSVRRLKERVSDSVPIEFEIQRARDLLEELIPEVHASLKIVAQEEVEVESLEKEIERERLAVGEERGRIAALREKLKTPQTSFHAGNRSYTRTDVAEELARRFEHCRTAEILLGSKESLLKNRRAALDAAIKKLDKTRGARVELAAQTEALEGQFRLLQAQSAGTSLQLDDSKLAQTERLLGSLKKRLEVAQRVLAREARFVEAIPVEAVNEESLVESVDRYLGADGRPQPVTAVRAEF